MNRTFALIAALCGCVASCAAHPQRQNLSGKYHTADSQADSQLSLEVHQQEQTATVDFSAGNASGRGAAPEGSGKGQLTSDGGLRLQFEDSFGNEGTGELKATGPNYHLSLTATSVTEPRALTHNGSRTLLKKPTTSSASHTDH